MSISIIAGSTGLVGSSILSYLSDHNHKPIALARSSIKELPSNAQELIIDYDSLLTEGSLPSCDHVFVCLGTTIKIAKGKENFKIVDLDYPLAVAQKALDSGAKKLTLISSVGADSKSKNFLKHKTMILKQGENKQILIPPMHLNGFLCLSNSCVFHYKLCYKGKYFDAGNQISLKWNEEKIVTITTEFGPPNYMPTIPFTEKPLSDQWENNIFIMNMLKKRIKKMN